MRIFEVGTVFRATATNLKWRITGINYDDETYAWEYITKDGYATTPMVGYSAERWSQCQKRYYYKQKQR